MWPLFCSVLSHPQFFISFLILGEILLLGIFVCLCNCFNFILAFVNVGWMPWFYLSFACLIFLEWWLRGYSFSVRHIRKVALSNSHIKDSAFVEIRNDSLNMLNHYLVVGSFVFIFSFVIVGYLSSAAFYPSL